MNKGRCAFGIALLAVLCVTLVFFFPAMQGPYSAVHGPVTVMHAARAAAGLRVAVARAGMHAVRTHTRTALLLSPAVTVPKTELETSASVAAGGISLRC